MAEITVFLDDAVAARVRAVAEAEGESEGGWIARRVEEALSSLWPEELRLLAGAWPSDPRLPNAARAGFGVDRRRDPLLRDPLLRDPRRRAAT